MANSTMENSKHRCVLILEDDACHAESQQFVKVVRKALSSAPAGWQTIQLGCQYAGVAISERRRYRWLSAARRYAMHIAERCYQAHAYLVSKVGCQVLSQYLSRGFTPDGSLAALQSANARKGLLSCLYVKPDLMVQASHESRTCTAHSWQIALRSMKKIKQPAQTSSKKIKKKFVKQVRSTAGRRGGLCNAGSGSSEAKVRKKINLMMRYAQKHSEWPSKRMSSSKWKVSTKLWSRARKTHWSED